MDEISGRAEARELAQVARVRGEERSVGQAFLFVGAYLLGLLTTMFVVAVAVWSA